MSSVLIIKSVTDKEWFPVNIHVIKDFFAKAGQLLSRYCKRNLELLPFASDWSRDFDSIWNQMFYM